MRGIERLCVGLWLWHSIQGLTNSMNCRKRGSQQKTCTTGSLREFLAQQSQSAAGEDSQELPPAVEIQLDLGDGRRELLLVDSTTDIQAEAEAFCSRYQLEPYVRDLLADSISSQYQRQSQQERHRRKALFSQQLRGYYANSSAKEVLIPSAIRDQQKQTPIFLAQNYHHFNVPHGSLFQKESLLQKEEPLEKESLLQKEEPLERETKTYQSQQSVYSLQKKGSLSNKENKPSINGVSQQICDKLGKQNIINLRKQRSTERLQALQREKEQREARTMQECLFRPKINIISERVDREITTQATNHRRPDRCELLYEHSKQLQSKRAKLREEVQAQLRFQPAINLISKKIVEGRKHLEASQQSHLNPKQSGHQDCLKEKGSSQPKTGRNPLSRNREGLPIGDYLYRQAKRRSRPPAELKQQVKALQRSDYLVAMLKEKKLKEIFVELTAPPHAFISPEDITALDELQVMRHRLLKPLLEEIVQVGVTLKEAAFLEAGLNLVGSLTPQQRYELVFRKKQEGVADLSLQCTITRNRSGETNEDLYVRGKAQLELKQQRLELSREQRARSELRGCTFRPVINK